MIKYIVGIAMLTASMSYAITNQEADHIIDELQHTIDEVNLLRDGVTPPIDPPIDPPVSTVGLLTVSIMGGSGSLVSTPAGIDCPGACSYNFTPGELVEVATVPDAGSEYWRWETGTSGWGGVVRKITILDAGNTASVYFRASTTDPVVPPTDPVVPPTDPVEPPVTSGFMPDLLAGTGESLPAFATTGPALDAFQSFATSGPGTRNYSIQMHYSQTEQVAYYMGGNHNAPHKFNDVWSFDVVANEWTILHRPDTGVRTLHTYFGGAWDDTRKKLYWFDGHNTGTATEWPALLPDYNIASWDKATDTWSPMANSNFRMGISNVAVLFPEQDQLWMYSASWKSPRGIQVMDLATNTLTELYDNDHTYRNDNAPKAESWIDYSRTTGKMVGGLNLDSFVYDIPTNTWTKTVGTFPAKVHARHSTIAYSQSRDLYYMWSTGLFWSFDPKTAEVVEIVVPGMFDVADKEKVIMYFDDANDVLVMYRNNNVQMFVYRPDDGGAFISSVTVPNLITAVVPPTDPVVPPTDPTDPPVVVDPPIVVGALNRVTPLGEMTPPDGLTPNPNFGAQGVVEKVWCPDGNGSFAKVAQYKDVPNDPIGDGKNKCYMEAFDTSVFSTDNSPVMSCANLDLTKFPGHTCSDVTTPQEYQDIKLNRGKFVAIINNDLEIEKGKVPWMGGNIESVWLIGAYDEATMRPVHITTLDSTFSWNSTAPENQLTMMNLRLKSENFCASLTGARQVKAIFTAQSITGRCRGRFTIAPAEFPIRDILQVADLTDYKIDNEFYMRGSMFRSRTSHGLYVNIQKVAVIEDSIVLGSRSGGKHPIKCEAHTCIIRNNIISNAGMHGFKFEETEDFIAFDTFALAPLSLSTQTKNVLQDLTIIAGHGQGSNQNVIQHQYRDEAGEFPRGYWPSVVPSVKYTGQDDYTGTVGANVYWTQEFWDSIDKSAPLTDPNMFLTTATGIEIIQRYEDQARFQPFQRAFMSRSTMPVTRPSLSTASGFFDLPLPPGWKERQMVVASGNCLDNGLLRTNVYRSWPHIWSVQEPLAASRVSDIDNTDKLTLVGDNWCDQNGQPEPEVVQARDRLISNTPAPPWASWL